MKKRKAFISAVCLLLVVLMVLSITVMVIAPTMAYAATSDDIQAEIDDLNDQKDEIQGRMDDIESEIEGLNYEQANTLEKKLILDQKNLLAQEELDVIQEQIDIVDGLIASMQEDLNAARAEEEYQRERWLARVRAMEESGSVGYIEVLFNATSFSDLLTRLDLVNEVMAYDEQLEADYIAARENVETLESQAEAMYAENEANRQEMEIKKAQLETDLAAAGALIEQLGQDIDDYNAVLEQERQTQEEVAALIVEKEKELEEAKAAEEAARLAALAAQQAAQGGGGGGNITAPPAVDSSGNATGGSGFKWPTYTWLITSPYGYRTNPVSGIYKLHSGCDIGASYGSSIWAAQAGTVILAGWNGGYGNCVMINHGNGWTTLYGHMSSIAVSSGQYVSQGQTIGYVGSTGNSTGPHLHFEVRSSSTGNTIDPLSFTYY